MPNPPGSEWNLEQEWRPNLQSAGMDAARKTSGLIKCTGYWRGILDPSNLGGNRMWGLIRDSKCCVGLVE